MNQAELTLVLRSIGSIDNREDLDKVIETVRRRDATLNAACARQLHVGQEVSFKYRGDNISGKIIKFLPKNVKVKLNETGTVWRVSPSLLKIERIQK